MKYEEYGGNRKCGNLTKGSVTHPGMIVISPRGVFLIVEKSKIMLDTVSLNLSLEFVSTTKYSFVYGLLPLRLLFYNTAILVTTPNRVTLY